MLGSWEHYWEARIGSWNIDGNREFVPANLGNIAGNHDPVPGNHGNIAGNDPVIWFTGTLGTLLGAASWFPGTGNLAGNIGPNRHGRINIPHALTHSTYTH